MTGDLEIVPLAAGHLEAVAELERRAGDVGWSRGQFERELTLAMARFFVLTFKKRVAGYGGYWRVAEEAQVTNLVVDPSRRRAGYGRRMLQFLLEGARGEGCARATLEVRAGNTAALALYRSAGFVEVGRRPGVYRSPVEDAVLMERSLCVA